MSWLSVGSRQIHGKWWAGRVSSRCSGWHASHTVGRRHNTGTFVGRSSSSGVLAFCCPVSVLVSSSILINKKELVDVINNTHTSSALSRSCNSCTCVWVSCSCWRRFCSRSVSSRRVFSSRMKSAGVPARASRIKNSCVLLELSRASSNRPWRGRVRGININGKHTSSSCSCKNIFTARNFCSAVMRAWDGWLSSCTRHRRASSANFWSMPMKGFKETCGKRRWVDKICVLSRTLLLWRS